MEDEEVANHKQAKKRTRQRKTRTARNRVVRSEMRTYVKRLRSLIAGKDGSGAKELLGTAVKHLDKSVTKGILHRRNASRTISRLVTAVNKLSS